LKKKFKDDTTESCRGAEGSKEITVKTE
jgi:hypothetical protein